MSVKMSKSSQYVKSIEDIDQHTIERARIAEENYWKVREELRLKYGVKGEDSKA